MATLYVAKTGNDSYTYAQAQSQSTPVLTIGRGMDLMASGDRLEIKVGSYAEYFTRNKMPDGTVGAYTEIANFQNDVVTITYVANPSINGAIFWFSGQHYVRLDGLILDNSANVVGTATTIQLNSHSTDPCSYIEILNCTVKDNVKSNGITNSDSFSNNILIDNCVISGNGDPGSNLHHGIYIRGHTWTVSNCLIHDNTGKGIQIQKDGTGDIAYDCRIFNNKVYDNGTDGILVSSGDDIEVFNNLIYGNGKPSLGSGIELSGNGSPRNAMVYNNTIYDNGLEGIVSGASNYNAKIRNNLIFGNDGDDTIVWNGSETAGEETIIEYNVVGATVINNGSLTTNANNTTTADPLFINAGANNYHLQSGSDAIGAGTDVSATLTDDLEGVSRPQGATWDCGCYEFVAEAATGHIWGGLAGIGSSMVGIGGGLAG